jgi:hypothetical protein
LIRAVTVWLALTLTTGWAQVLVPLFALLLGGMVHTVYRLGRLTERVDYLTRIVEHHWKP